MCISHPVATLLQFHVVFVIEKARATLTVDTYETRMTPI